MSDENTPGEDTEIPAVKGIDEGKLEAVADGRYEAMQANPNRRGDPDLTYSAFCKGILNGRNEAISQSLRQAAKVWLAKSESSKIGDQAKKKLLAYKVLNGEFDA